MNSSLQNNLKNLELSQVEASSSLVLLFEQLFEAKEFLKRDHLLMASAKDLEKVRSFLHFKKPKWPWYELPPFPKPKSPYSESVWLKRKKWQSWARLSHRAGSTLFLASPHALLKKTDRSVNFFLLKKGEGFDSSILSDYKEREFVQRAGEYSSRSFLIDVFSPAYESPLRVQLLGDEVQSLHLLSMDFKKRERELDQALIPSLQEWNLKGEYRKELCSYLKKEEQKLKGHLPPELFRHFSRGDSYFGFENLLNSLNTDCSLDFFPVPPLVWIFDPEKTKEDFLEKKSELEREQIFFTEKNLFLPWEKIKASCPLVKIGASYPKFFEGKQSIESSYSKAFEREQSVEVSYPTAFEEKQTVKDSYPKTFNEEQIFSSSKESLPEPAKNFSSSQGKTSDSAKRFSSSQGKTSDSAKGFSSSEGNLPDFVKNFSSSLFKKPQSLKKGLAGLPVSNLVFTGHRLKELKQLFLKENILDSEEESFFQGKNLIFLPDPIKESFFCKGDTAYLRSEDFLLKKKEALSHFDFFQKRAKALEFSKLELGDLLVHRQYGVGEFAGLQTLETVGQREDFIVLKYREGDKLFIPAYKANQVKKYSRKRPDQITKTLLDALGNPKAWEKKKSKAKKHIQSLAIELIELYRERKQKKRKAFNSVPQAMNRFASEFPFEETADQKRAIQEIMSDMDGEHPMDRLLTADTGFGKTEVALRACFRTLENHFQVCLLAPTTVLALQHFENFKKRFQNTPFQLALLSRFISQKEREKIFEKAKAGEIDFLIATHSVFSPHLSFKNLGLLVLDEEHRFGVRQKERLFRFRKNMDVLALSATPIPRTLNMALTGIKDISVISRPPARRKPVRMILKGWDEGVESLIREACRKEKSRGGQVLFVHNRVKSLYQRAEHIQKLLPDFKIAIAKGQMDHLDKVILDFFEKKYDILISTNIIESGMDIPQANTLFIDRAHEMGLSQIYQLKGRVGRSSEQAFCYLLFPSQDHLSLLARERLRLLEKYAGLGEAFQLALHDLENRGAGSLFGSEQSGHLQSLGEDLYFEILNEELTHQKETSIEPEIFLPFSTGIPEAYIPEPGLRLLYYKNLSTAWTEEDRLALKQELIEDFGPLPEEVNHLFFLLEVRSFCKKLLIKNFRASLQNLSLTFHEETSVTPERLLQALYSRKGNLISDKSCKIPIQEDRFFEEIKEIFQMLSS